MPEPRSKRSQDGQLKAEGRVIAIQEMKVPEVTDTIAKEGLAEGGAYMRAKGP